MEEKILIVRSADQQFATLMFFATDAEATFSVSNEEIKILCGALSEYISSGKLRRVILLEHQILVVRNLSDSLHTIAFMKDYGVAIVLSDAELFELSVALTEFASDKKLTYKVVLLSSKL